MAEMNDVPAYLNELIPYRCPKCGNLRRFATLRELRQHLQTEHSFQMGFIKPHSRPCVFNRTNDVTSESDDRPHKSFPDLERIKRNDNKFNNSRTEFREISPLLKSFKDETEHLEQELQRAIQTEMKHKTVSLQSLAGNTINTDCHTALNAIHNDCHNVLNTTPRGQISNEREFVGRVYTQPSAHKPFVEKTKVTPFPTVRDPTMNTAMSSLNSHMMTSRMNQWITTDALQQSQELLHEMETSAETKCQEQRNIIQHLIHDMKVKDEQIESSKKRHSDLKNEREKLLHETESLVQETDEYNSKLQHDLNNKHSELDDLNKELTRLRKLSQHELHLKSQDLQQATERVNRLELERDNLIQETEAMLKRADTDNGRLKRQLKEKEAELRTVNESLKQIRSQQEQMLEKTMDVYQSSEDSREMMQTAIKTKDGQLQQAIHQIENMSSLQQRLVEQSRILTDQADDNTSSMKRLLRTKAKQMEDLMTQLETLRSEKQHIENNSACLAEKAESSSTAVESLQGMVKQRENDLKATQSELQNLKTFLKSAADKERVARQRLEKFIEDLIDRAERAESELKSLKSQSSDTLYKIGGPSTDSLQDTRHEESTDRKSLPSRLHEVHHDTFSRTGATRMPETFVEDSDTFVETIMQKTVSLQSKPSGHDRPTYISEEMDDAYIHHRNLQLQESGGFVISKVPADYDREDDEADGDIESTSLNNSKIMNGKQTHKTRRHRTNTHTRMSDSDSNIPDSKDRTNKKYQSKRHISESNQDSDHMKDGNMIIKHQTSSDAGPPPAGVLSTHTGCVEKQNKVSRGLQVGAFLSLQDAQNEHSDSCSTDSGEYDEHDDQNIEYANNDEDIHVTYATTGENRPATIGKSHNHEQVAKKKTRQTKKKVVLNDGFDTNFPEVHRSMVDILGDTRDMSEGEVRHRDRRSRSLSPRAMEAQQFLIVPDIVLKKLKLNRKTENGDEYEEGDATEYSVDTSMIEDLPRDVTKEHQQETEHTDGAFKNIMDENGILWDEDMATLPDVSDSELDRVSPSGSEAMSSKRRALQIGTTNSNSSLKDVKQSISLRRQNKRKESVVSPTTSTVVNLLNNSIKSDRRADSNSKRTYTPPESPTRRGVVFKTHANGNTKLQTDESLDISDNVFKPITSPVGAKNSVSDKDMTSGGREVHSYMCTSPKIDQYQSSDTRSFNGSRSYRECVSKSRSKDTKSENDSTIERDIHSDKGSSYKPRPSYSNKDSEDNNYSFHLKKESVEDKKRRISREYSPRHVKPSPDSKHNSTIEDKIHSINDKYNRRRHDILQSKGVSTMIEKKHERPFAFKQDGERTYDRKHDTKMKFTCSSSQYQNHSVNSIQRGQSLPTMKRNSPFGFSQIPVHTANAASPKPLPYIDFAQMTQHPAFTGQPFGQHDMNFNKETTMLGPQIPPVFPYLPNYMMYPYAMGAFQQQRSSENPTLQNEVLSHQIGAATNHTNVTPSVNPTLQTEALSQDVGTARNDTNVTPYVNPTLQTEALPHHVSTATNHTNATLSVNLDPVSATHPITVDTMHVLQTQNVEIPGSSNGIPKSSFQDVKVCTNSDEMSIPNSQTSRSDKPTDVEPVHNSVSDVPLSNELEGVRIGFLAHCNTDVTTSDDKHGYYADESVKVIDHSEKEIDTAYEEFQPAMMEPRVSYIRDDPLTDSPEVVYEHTEPSIMEESMRTPHLSIFNDIDNTDSSVGLNKSSLFAEEIEDDTSIEHETNSYLDLPGNATESELDGDTDTESVRRDFYEKSKHIQEVLEATQNDRSDAYRRRTTVMSSASSQASFEIEDKIPSAKREQVKLRRAALVCVFSFLDTRTLTCVSRVCREWRIVSRSPKLWRRVELRGEKVSPKFLRRISRRCSQLRILILENLHPRNRFATETVEEYQANIRCSLENGYEQILKKAEATFHTIVIINCGQLLSAKCLWIASCCCRMLKHVTYLSDFDPINAEVMWALGSGCRELKTLKCQPLLPCARESNFTTRCSQMIGQCFKELETLSVGGRNIDVSSLIFIAKHCQKLTRIEIHQMKFLSCDVIDDMCQNGLHNLKSISLLSTPIAPGALTLLEVQCKRLDHVFIRLTAADFRSCKQDQNAPAMPEYHEIIDGYEVLKKQPTFIKKLLLDVEAPSVLQRTLTIEEPEKETSFFDRWFK